MIDLKFWFAHPPKCGGNSVWAMLEQVTGKPFFRINNTTDKGWSFIGQPLAAFEQWGAIGGHVPYAFGMQLPYRWKRITWLRDPVDRALSYYTNMLIGRTQVDWVPFRQWLDACGPIDTPGLYGMSFTLGWTLNLAAASMVEQWADNAIERLRHDFSFVGFIDEPEESMRRFNATFGTSAELPRKHVTPREKYEPTAKEMRLLRKRMEPEQRVYDAAREMISRHKVPEVAQIDLGVC